MIKKITLINFMSHRETVIEPAKGLTVIAGENNCGKSAIVAAIQCVCANATGQYMVRHGEKECRVILETDDGHVVEWKRANRKVSYVVDGETIDRTRGKVPEKVEQALRMGKVEAENEEFDVHFADQKKPVFLLDGTAGQRAAFFASSSDAAKLIEMQSLHKTKLAEAQRDIREQQNRESNLLHRLDRLNPVEAVEAELEIASQLEAEILRADHKIQTLALLIEATHQASREEARFNRQVASLSKLGTVPEFKLTDGLESLHAQIHDATCLRKISAASRKSLRDLPQLPEIADCSRLKILIQELESNRRTAKACLAIANQLELPQPPAITESVSRLTAGQQLKNNLQTLKKEVARWEQVRRLLPKLDSIGEDIAADPLAKQIVAQSQALQECEELQRQCARAVTQTQTAHEELHRALEETGTCPTCGQEMNLTRSGG